MARVVIAVLAAGASLLLLAPAFAAAALFLMIASSARTIGRLLERPFVPWTELISFDPCLGWRPRPDLDTHYLADHDDVFRVVSDGEGWPGLRPLDDSRVVAIGDSFAFGYGVDAGRSFAEIDPGLPLKAVGAPGYSMVQGVLLMEQLAPRLNGKLVVWLIYMENDLQDNLAPEMRGYRSPFVRRDPVRGEWEIAADHLRPARWECSFLDRRRLFPRFCVPGPLADRAYSACDYLIRRARVACDAAGAHLAVVTVPHPMQLSASGMRRLAALSGRPESCDGALPDRRIAESCRKHGVPILAGRDYLAAADYKAREGIHWNERGHRQMARLLRRLYDEFRSGALDGLAQPTGGEGSGAARPVRMSAPVDAVR
jgi:hypothetical protein